MAVATQTSFVPTKRQNLPIDKQRVISVLQELIKRKAALNLTRKTEIKWKTLFFFGCASGFALALLSLYQRGSWLVSFWLYAAVFCVDCVLIIRVKRSREAAQKATVNFGVVRHHLVGLIEVGRVCDCTWKCECKEELRRQTMIEHGISLY